MSGCSLDGLHRWPGRYLKVVSKVFILHRGGLFFLEILSFFVLFTVLLEGVQIFPEINVGRLLNICVSVFQQTQPNTRQKTGPFKTYPVNIDNLPDSTKLTDQTHKHSISFTLKHAQHKLVKTKNFPCLGDLRI